MMTDLTAAPHWTSVDVENLRVFLDTQTGQRFLAHLATARPKVDVAFVGAGNSIHLLGKVAGADALLSHLLFLRTSESSDEAQATVAQAAAVVSEQYPNLDRDEGWEKHLRLSSND